MTTPDGDSTPSSSSSTAPLPSAPRPAASGWTWLALLVAAAGLGCSIMLWQKVTNMQEQLARQSADAIAQATQAQHLARDSQDLIRDANNQVGALQTRVNEMQLQREQIETLVDSLTRSRDDTVVVDIEAAIATAQQQIQLTGNTAPLVAALQSSIKRLELASQPRLVPLQQAMEKDLDQLSQSTATDTFSLLARLDEAVRLVDDLKILYGPPEPDAMHPPTATAVTSTPNEALVPDPAATPAQWVWWSQWAKKIWTASLHEARSLVRVSNIDNADVMLLAPNQAFFIRENLKLQLLNARLAILARQYDAARVDIADAQAAIGKYFDPQAHRTLQTLAVLTQLQANLQVTKNPSLDHTLAALSAAIGGL